MNVAVLRKKWFLSDAALADIFLSTYAPPDPKQCWHLRKRASAGKTRIFSKIGMKKIDKMQENENRVQTETRRFCLVSVREKHFRYVFEDVSKCFSKRRPKRRRDPPDPGQCWNENFSFSLKETPTRANTGPSIDAASKRGASNIVWGCGGSSPAIEKSY